MEAVMGFIPGLGNIFNDITKIVGDLASGNLPGVLQDVSNIFSELSQSLFQNGGSPSSIFQQNPGILQNQLPNPMQSSLSGLLSGSSSLGGINSSNIGAVLQQLLSGTGNAPLSGFNNVVGPSLSYRLPVMGNYATGALQNAVNYMPVQPPVYSPVGDPGFGNSGGSNSVVQQAINSGAFSDAPSSDEQQMLNQISDPAEKARMELQLKLQKQAEISSMISNILNIKHQTAQGIISNMKQ